MGTFVPVADLRLMQFQSHARVLMSDESLASSYEYIPFLSRIRPHFDSATGFHRDRRSFGVV